MFWNDEKILHWAINGGIKPFDATAICHDDWTTWPGQLGGASIDLTLSNLVAVPQLWTHMERRKLRFGNKADMAQIWTVPFIYEEFTLESGSSALFSTAEQVYIPDNACAFLISRSSTGRCLIEHMHAGFGDPGFIESTWTLEVVNFSGADWVFKPGDRIVQMVMGELTAPAKRPYWVKGRYSGQIAPTPPKGWE